ncbi:hypothetical protein [Streptomyces scopuliridis]|uniref:Uncharacterized protein n=1 Tax=Streptomyces scopuliridis TaxID=452529 RepID=A0ACD4ZW15_9ACTN|nr:hypothetical protein [Streptomyces scopuliridis]WSC01237.1 hypothetical protein OG835_32400 [Streptomyces scopuliridis]
MTAIDAGEPTPAEKVMDRADLFRAAHVLVTSLDWGDSTADVIDVLRVAEFLAEGEE